MKYVDEFRDPRLSRQLADIIAAEVDPNREYRLMEFCGGHTHAIFRYGVQDLMPANLRFVHGPGCPVCVLPTSRIDQAIALAERRGVILCTYADMMRVPGGDRRSLLKSKALGCDIRMVYSTRDALAIAREEPSRQVVFFAIGFETTTPPTAVALKRARAEALKNFSVFCSHVLTPPALRAILASAEPVSVSIDGILGPSHVSTVIGSDPYRFVPKEFGKPLTIAGFEPLDLMQATLMLIRQINEDRCEVENQYRRAVESDGNRKARALMDECFEIREIFEWRGLGFLPNSALRVGSGFTDLDAEVRFPLELEQSRKGSSEIGSCECPSILRGVKRPTDCKLFGTVCTPDSPMGACMVSSEGACAAYWSYGRFRDADSAAARVAG